MNTLKVSMFCTINEPRFLNGFLKTVKNDKEDLIEKIAYFGK